MHQQAKAKRIRNKCGLAEILCRNAKRVQGVWGTGNHTDHPTAKGCVQPADERHQRRAAGRNTNKFLGSIRWVCKGVWQSE